MQKKIIYAFLTLLFIVVIVLGLIYLIPKNNVDTINNPLSGGSSTTTEMGK